MKYSVARTIVTLLVIMAVGLCQDTLGQNAGRTRLISTIKKRIAVQGPTHIFSLYSVEALSNYYYLIQVRDEGGKTVLQSLNIRNGVRLENKPGSFQIVDVNSDGYDDIKVLGGHQSGKAWYKVWFYDRKTHTYVWAEDSPSGNSLLIPSSHKKDRAASNE